MMETYTVTKYKYIKGESTPVEIPYCMYCNKCLEYDTEHNSQANCIEHLKSEIDSLRSDFKELDERMDSFMNKDYY
jgi:hypothetical protein